MVKAYCANYKPDIVAITESKLGEDFEDNLFLGADFTMISNDCNKGAGGVLLAISNQIGNIQILNRHIGPGESIIVTIKLCHQMVFNIILQYRPQGENHLNNFEELLLNNPSHHCNILIGDINLPDINW